jgi:hypothetical protein
MLAIGSPPQHGKSWAATSLRQHDRANRHRRLLRRVATGHATADPAIVVMK